MHISKMNLHNFRLYKGDYDFEFGPGMNFFVGNNNTGKTTVFKAIDFLLNGKEKDGWINQSSLDEDVFVEIELSSIDEAEFSDPDALKKLLPYLTNDKSIRLRRDSADPDKDPKNALKTVRIFNPETKEWDTPASIDKIVKSLIEPIVVESDLDNTAYQDFGKTKTLGQLIFGILENYAKDTQWLALESAYKDAFGPAGLGKYLDGIANEVDEYLESQYGKSETSFDFEMPPIDTLVKSGKIKTIDVNGIDTEVSEKGTGMQRAIALALIQVYAKHNRADSDQPMFFFIDEPETFLHPSAQNNLLASLDSIANANQVFITTHSPYLLKSFNKKDHCLTVLSHEGDKIHIESDVNMNLFGHSPTWGEINYFAFRVPSVEFHIELFGKLQEDQGIKGIAEMDKWLAKQVGMKPTDADHQNVYPNGYVDQTMSAYIRNLIDHPNDRPTPNRKEPTQSEIADSIEFMLTLV